MEKNNRLFISVLAVLFLLTSCYNHGQQTPDAWDLTKEQIDSISFSTSHHYTQGYNFVVNADSLLLQGDEGDSLHVVKHDRLVVADINIQPQDTIDSVWVKVARDQLTLGWIHETELLKDFLYEAIFIPKVAEAPARDIIEKPELRVYTDDFGTQKGDNCLVADFGGKVVGAVWKRISVEPSAWIP